MTAPDAKSVPISEFKARCLGLLQALRETGGEIVVTKRGAPIARVTPLPPPGKSLRGWLRGRIQFHGDIVHANWTDDWEAAR